MLHPQTEGKLRTWHGGFAWQKAHTRTESKRGTEVIRLVFRIKWCLSTEMSYLCL